MSQSSTMNTDPTTPDPTTTTETSRRRRPQPAPLLTRVEREALYRWCGEQIDRYASKKRQHDTPATRAQMEHLAARWYAEGSAFYVLYFDAAQAEAQHWQRLAAGAAATWTRRDLDQQQREREAFLREAREDTAQTGDHLAATRHAGALLACEALRFYLHADPDDPSTWQFGCFASDTAGVPPSLWASLVEAATDIEGFTTEQRRRLVGLRARVAQGGATDDDTSLLSHTERERLCFAAYYTLRSALPAARTYARQRRRRWYLLPSQRQRVPVSLQSVYARASRRV